MAGGAAGTPNQMGSASPAAPSQASQYSNYGAQPNGAFYAGPMSGAPASGGSYAQPSMPTYQSQPAQQGFGQGYGGEQAGFGSYQGGYSPQTGMAQVQRPQFGGMGGFPGQGYGFGGIGNQFMGGGYGYQPQPQYGYGGMGNQFMGGGMGGFDPYGGRPARSFGGRDMYGPRGGFDPRMAMQQMYGQQAVAQQAATQQPQTATAAPRRTEADWNRFAAQAQFATGTDMEQVKKDWMNQTPPTQSGLPGFGGLGSVNMMTGRPWESRSQRAQIPMQSLYAQMFGGYDY